MGEFYIPKCQNIQTKQICPEFTVWKKHCKIFALPDCDVSAHMCTGTGSKEKQ